MQVRLFTDKVLKISEEDVLGVYNLSRSHKKINLNDCTNESIERLRKELHLPDFVTTDNVETKTFQHAMGKLKNEEAWLKAAVLYLISSLLCPQSRPEISLKYAHILEETTQISKYNWCEHILTHLGKGLEKKQSKQPISCW
ncbi:hypothetical protein LIER_23616 [Lithospermum erythrorhizon]|uniref:Uncharacterized protein n=1 Tax=Lithospermum erythrorhizon TaxID=34254 RepID=A0AAV3R2C7_LITER